MLPTVHTRRIAVRWGTLAVALLCSPTLFGQAPPGQAQSHPLEGLLIVASTDESPYPGDPRKKSAVMAATMAHLDKNQFNPINFIPKDQAPTIFLPIASPHGRIFLFTYDETQSDPMKQEEFRMSLPFQSLSYELTPPFLRRGTKDILALMALKGLKVSTNRTLSRHQWSWAPDGKRLMLLLDNDRWIYSNGGARQITVTGSVPNVFLQGFAQDSKHVLYSTSNAGSKFRYYVARLPDRQDSISQDELFRNATQVPFGDDSTGMSRLGDFLYSPNGEFVAFVATSGKLPNSMAMFAGAHDNPRQVHLAKGVRSSLATGAAPGTILGQDSIAGEPQAGKPYQVKFCNLLILGWSQDGRNLYFRQSEKSGQGIAESQQPSDHKVQHTNQIWSWNAERGVEKVMDIPVLSDYSIVGCPISRDERWLVMWGIDLPGDMMTSKEHTSLTVGERAMQIHLYAIDLKAKKVRKIWRRSSHFDYATFTKPERWEGEVFPGFNPNKRGEELPDHFLKFTSPVTVKSWQHQWAFELNFEGNVHDFAQRRNDLHLEATVYRPNGDAYRDSDGEGKNKDGLAASFLPFKTAQLSVSADAFRGTYYVPLSDIELIAADKTDVDVVLKLYEGDKLRGETKPASRVTIGAADIPRAWFKNIKVTTAVEDDQPGILVTAEAATVKLTAWDLRFEAAVRHPDLKPIPARNVAYRGSDDTAAAKSTHRLTRDDDVVPVRLFVPLGELQLAKGERTVNVQLQARILEKNFVGASRQTAITVRVP